MIPGLLGIAAGSYLIGSIPSGYLLGRLHHVDVRLSGSGNIGATNVARSLGARAGLATLAIDVAKGFLPVALAQTWAAWPPAPGATPEGVEVAAATAAVGATLGHIFSIFLRFRGGKGVATALGAILALLPAAAVVAVLVFALTFLLSRIVSLSSLSAALSAPLAAVALGAPALILATTAVLAVSVVLSHRENLARLRAGTEPRVDSRKNF